MAVRAISLVPDTPAEVVVGLRMLGVVNAGVLLLAGAGVLDASHCEVVATLEVLDDPTPVQLVPTAEGNGVEVAATLEVLGDVNAAVLLRVLEATGVDVAATLEVLDAPTSVAHTHSPGCQNTYVHIQSMAQGEKE